MTYIKMKKEIKYNLKCYMNFIAMIFSKIIIFFGYEYDKSVIPKGPYCYVPDDKRNETADSFEYFIKPCKYYKYLGKELNGCQYLGIITDDFVFDDQCKMCSENYGKDEDYI